MAYTFLPSGRTSHNKSLLECWPTRTDNSSVNRGTQTTTKGPYEPHVRVIVKETQWRMHPDLRWSPPPITQPIWLQSATRFNPAVKSHTQPHVVSDFIPWYILKLLLCRVSACACSMWGQLQRPANRRIGPSAHAEPAPCNVFFFVKSLDTAAIVVRYCILYHAQPRRSLLTTRPPCIVRWTSTDAKPSVYAPQRNNYLDVDRRIPPILRSQIPSLSCHGRLRQGLRPWIFSITSWRLRFSYILTPATTRLPDKRAAWPVRPPTS